MRYRCVGFGANRLLSRWRSYKHLRQPKERVAQDDSHLCLRRRTRTACGRRDRRNGGRETLARHDLHRRRASDDRRGHGDGKKGDSAGDLLTFGNGLYNAGNTKKIGTDDGYCIRTAVGKSWECEWTAFLAGGQIVVEGPFLDAGRASSPSSAAQASTHAPAAGWISALATRRPRSTTSRITFRAKE